MRIYHVTYKKNLESIKKYGLRIDYHLSNSLYTGQTSGQAIYLSKYIKGNNLPIKMHNEKDSLISLEINLDSLNQDLIYPDDGIYWAFGNEEIFSEDDLEEIMDAFNLSKVGDAVRKLEYLESLLDEQLPKEFKNIWRWYLENEGEIAYLGNIDFELISDVIEL